MTDPVSFSFPMEHVSISIMTCKCRMNGCAVRLERDKVITPVIQTFGVTKCSDVLHGRQGPLLTYETGLIKGCILGVFSRMTIFAYMVWHNTRHNSISGRIYSLQSIASPPPFVHFKISNPGLQV